MRIVASHLAKFLEDSCLILRRDPDPCVTDRNLHRAVNLPCVNSDPPSLWRELYGIGKKVKKDLFDLALIADELPKSLVNCNIEVDAVLCGSLPYKGAGIIYCQGKIERCQLQLHPPSLNFRKVQDLIDKGQQMTAGGENVLGILGLFFV